MKLLSQLYQELNLLDASADTLSITEMENYEVQRNDILRQIKEQESEDGIQETIDWFNEGENYLTPYEDDDEYEDWESESSLNERLEDCQDFI